MAIWYNGVYQDNLTPEERAVLEFEPEPVPPPEKEGSAFSPAFTGFYFCGIEYAGRGSGGDQTGDGSLYWYDNLQIEVGTKATIGTDYGLKWKVLPPDPKVSTFSGVPCRAGVVEVTGPVLDSGTSIEKFSVTGLAEGSAVVRLECRMPDWMLKQLFATRAREVQAARRLKAQAQMKQKMRLAAQKLLYGDDYKPDKKAEFEEAQVPLWGWAKDNDEDEGVTVFELQFDCVKATSTTATVPAATEVAKAPSSSKHSATEATKALSSSNHVATEAISSSNHVATEAAKPSSSSEHSAIETT